MLALARAAALDPALIPRVSVKMKKLNGLISWGPVMTVTEMEAIPQDFRALLFHPFPAGLEVTDLWLTPTISRDRALYLGSEGLPRFFSWIYPNRIAGMSTPRTQADCDLLREIGFTHVLSLTEESPLPEIWFEWGMNHVFLPIPNYGAPTLQEMDLIYEKIKEGGMWLVHCGGGVGRAGTVLACLITMLGKEGIEGDTPKLDSNTAIKLLREVRPRSLESEKQEQFVAAWVSHRWKTAYLDNWIPEPCTTLRQEGESPLPEGSILFLIGKPGSGKSWLAAAISKRKPRNKTIVISQDDGGSRAACEREFGRQDGNDTLVIFDRCNPLEDDRKFWLKLTDRPCVAVYFDYPKDLCAQRINLRFGHPTIRAGRGANALDQFNREMQPPTLDEEFVAILTITSLVAARDAVRLIAKDPPLLKFPRTPHLLDLGATTDDDIVLEDFPTMTGKLTLEEKIDGANMGFSLDWDGVIRCQNRSHWVSSNDHSQFKPLDRWIEDHSDALRILLDRDVHFPERYILYGEWMVAKHSIHYTHLPGPFVAFDLYDRLTQTFLSRSVLTKALKGSGIPQVPLVAQLETITKEDVLLLLDSKSAYASGSKIEGVYIKTEDADRQRVVGRGKVVRGDFIAGNDHWTKGNLTLNGLAREEEWLDLTALQNLAL
jgi:atypical dual specificity phosphatase